MLLLLLWLDLLLLHLVTVATAGVVIAGYFVVVVFACVFVAGVVVIVVLAVVTVIH